MSIETMTKLATVTVGSGGSATIDFTNIPQTYTDLVVTLSGRIDTTFGNPWYDTYLVLNSASGTTKDVYGTGNSKASGSDGSNIRILGVPSSDATASIFSNVYVYISGYSSSNFKPISIDSVSENNATSAMAQLGSSLYSSTSPITSLTLDPYSTGNFVQYSTATLYGIKNARQTAGNSIKATGGNISFDGTYVVHTFTSSGTFTPTANLIADYLVVAGGAGGGSSGGSGGGGGAGGLRCTVGATGGGGTVESRLQLSAGSSYVVTVGAGGIGSAGNAAGSGGSDSVFSTITSTGGGTGGGSGAGPSTGGTGGSGGGGTFNNNAGGSGTANQGYAGGTGKSTGSPTTFVGGAGGGAGAVGGDGNTSTLAAGNGGSGVTTTISGSSVAYAGGGGGGATRDSGGSAPTAGTGGTGGGGNGGLGSSTVLGNGSNAITNTGGGGGGGGTQTGVTYATGGNGGSGIVIVRYKA